ncbi:asparagine--tRNA ligase [Candidatus Dependentiae bacterium]|nr:asparagine--tRNA ligase [Candidatus Dependentiae bacterium]
MRIKIKNITPDHIDTTITIKGWVRSVRSQKEFSFITVNDGSTFNGLQLVMQATAPGYEETLNKLTTGTSIEAKGKLIKSMGKGQVYELADAVITGAGVCDAEIYPLQKKQHSFEFLREIAHLRPRTNTFGAVARARNALSFATHTFFQERGFLYLHTPIITASDCEGAGQMFQVTTLPLNQVPKTPGNHVDYAQDFFGKPAFLTVSGQLNGEAYACALSDIYTFGPTFRAENSNTSRHLAEFWMIEPEMAFADLHDNMALAESYLKHCLTYLLNQCSDDMSFFNQYIEKGVISKLEHVIQTPFEQLPYTDAIEILKKAPKKFQYPVNWGVDLQSEHERYLAEEYFKKPVILINYPAAIKAFYMRMNDDEKTVAAMDVLCPGIGEIIGGAQREERLDILERRMAAMNLKPEDYSWYLDLRKFGTVPHAGFGLGLERLVLFATGMENIRDVIPFPRTPKHADF